MGWIHKRLGYGIFGTIDSTNPDDPPQVTLNRPSSKFNRTYVEGALASQTTDQTVYTVTSGKRLYITSLKISGVNESDSTVGTLLIQDDSTLKIPLTLGYAATAQASLIPAFGLAYTFPEPKRFDTNINVAITSGVITYSISFTGYEEDI